MQQQQQQQQHQQLRVCVCVCEYVCVHFDIASSTLCNNPLKKVFVYTQIRSNMMFKNVTIHILCKRFKIDNEQLL